MRSLGIVLMFVSAGMVWACWADWPVATVSQAGDSPVQVERPTGWRRTASGWQRSQQWSYGHARAWIEAVHPTIPAALMVLVSVAALVAFSAGSPADRRDGLADGKVPTDRQP